MRFRVIDLRFQSKSTFFARIFEALQKNLHLDENLFSTKRKFSLDIPKLQYFPIGTRVLTAKYCNTGMQVLDVSKTRFFHCVVQNRTEAHRVCV